MHETALFLGRYNLKENFLCFGLRGDGALNLISPVATIYNENAIIFIDKKYINIHIFFCGIFLVSIMTRV